MKNKTKIVGKVIKGSIWKDRDSRSNNRVVVVVGFENVGGGRRTKIQRFDEETRQPSGRVTTTTKENIQKRFSFMGMINEEKTEDIVPAV